MTNVFGQPGSPAPIFGDESDGTVTESSNRTISNGYVFADVWTVESGVTIEIDNAVVFATERIVIEGTVHADGNGESGGAGGNGTTGAGQDGSAGSDGQVDTGAAGGDGGDPQGTGDTGGSGGAGGGTTYSSRQIQGMRVYPSDVWSPFFDGTMLGGPGGGGGGGGEGDGGGTGGDGGNGGTAGGAIALIAPTITNKGTIRSNGLDGADGQDGTASGSEDAGGGGGGGGGCGGPLFTVTEEWLNSGTIDLTGGDGGAAGADVGSATFNSADPGEAGPTGTHFLITS